MLERDAARLHPRRVPAPGEPHPDVVPNVAIHTDIIVGFCGETAEQFERTYDLLAELKLDKVHLAMYSPRPGTVSARRMADDVPPEEKKRRWDALDALQAQVVGEINRRLLGADGRGAGRRPHKGTGVVARAPTSSSSSTTRRTGAAGWRRSGSPGPAPGR